LKQDASLHTVDLSWITTLSGPFSGSPDERSSHKILLRRVFVRGQALRLVAFTSGSWAQIALVRGAVNAATLAASSAPYCGVVAAREGIGPPEHDADATRELELTPVHRLRQCLAKSPHAPPAKTKMDQVVVGEFRPVPVKGARCPRAAAVRFQRAAATGRTKSARECPYQLAPLAPRRRIPAPAVSKNAGRCRASAHCATPSAGDLGGW
jgi:hypothetical protein